MKIIHKNKKAYFDYEILQKFTAGMVLTGPEIKSIREGKVNLKGAYVTIQQGEAFLKNMHISKYSYAQQADYDPFRIRKLLLNKREIEKIANQLNTQGVSVVPLDIFIEKSYAKCLIALVRGRKKADKRHVIREREVKRQLDRAVRKRV
ncbi:SsrA-binding protein SmpB [Candidatus Peregrinibacteria bacterium]|nr:SsrA-binding protein SmpB [Candidatus Peregrinibacteria bacterium]